MNLFSDNLIGFYFNVNIKNSPLLGHHEQSTLNHKFKENDSIAPLKCTLIYEVCHLYV